mmetsp:Transcript_28310/g.5149  ORF Transcript_28310/g.5149 Transcript_28310/m.5149 type:complete len:93 (+) Transcript_28310:316-594(+)
MNFALYNINYDYFTTVEVFFEFGISGFLNKKVKINSIHISYYVDSWLNMKDSADKFFEKVPELYTYCFTLFGLLIPTIRQMKNNFKGFIKSW